LQNTKLLFSKLQDKKSANKVKKTLSKRYLSRKGGYTRIIKSGFRYGDKAPMAVFEFVDRNIEAKKVDKKKKEFLEFSKFLNQFYTKSLHNLKSNIQRN